MVDLTMRIATHLAVFYATESKILRRKVILDNDVVLRQLHAEPGESVLLLPLSRPYDDAAAEPQSLKRRVARHPAGDAASPTNQVTWLESVMWTLGSIYIRRGS